METDERTSSIEPAGVMAMASTYGSPSGDRKLGSTGNSREPGRAVWGDGEARSTDEAG